MKNLKVILRMGDIWILVANDLFEGGLNQSLNIDYKKETRLLELNSLVKKHIHYVEDFVKLEMPS
jgi:hypothetical protein